MKQSTRDVRTGIATGTALLLLCTPLTPSNAELTGEYDTVVGGVAPDGGARLIKHFRVAPGTVVAGVELANSDPRSTFPSIQVLRGASRITSELSVVAHVEQVSPSSGHNVSVAITPVAVEEWEDFYVVIELPARVDETRFGQGAGILAKQLDGPGDSYFSSSPEAAWGRMDVEYAVRLISGAAGKPAVQVKEAFTRAHPNPFNPKVTIELSVPRAELVHVHVHDVAGRLVNNITNERMGPGLFTRTWDGKDERGRQVASGIYFVRVQIGTEQFSRKLVLAK